MLQLYNSRYKSVHLRNQKLEAKNLPEGCGFVYVAVGKKYIREVEHSAATLRRHCPSAHITLFAPEGGTPELFDNIVRTSPDEHNRVTKIKVLLRSPYGLTVFIDTDTHFCSDPSELFAVLDKFDIAASLAAQEILVADERVPDCFVEHNTGVVAFRKNEAVRQLAEIWLEDYLRLAKLKSFGPDQTPFRYALYTSNVRIAALPNRYNCRLPTIGLVMSPVVIIHGHSKNFSRWEKNFNRGIKRDNVLVRKLHLPIGRGFLIFQTVIPWLIGLLRFFRKILLRMSKA